MSPSSNDTGRADPPDPGSEQRLLNRVRRGSSSAVGALFERYAPWLRRRASGRLPQWARSGVATSDLVQDVLHHAFARLKWFESKHVSALRAYLRRAVENRVQDGLRQAIRRLDISRLAPGEEPLRPFEDAAPQYQQPPNISSTALSMTSTRGGGPRSHRTGPAACASSAHNLPTPRFAPTAKMSPFSRRAWRGVNCKSPASF